MRILLITVFLIPLLVHSQTPRQIIRDMKNSVLLVRLKTRENSIQALKEAGHYDQMKIVQDKQREENKKIVTAFQEDFDFCPVFFFYSSCSKQVREHQFQNCLMNAELKLLSNEAVTDIDHFYIAEFWYVERSDDEYFSHYSFDPDDEGNMEKRSNYSGSPELGVDALVLRDSNFRQLKKPFPYYVRTYQGFPFRRSESKTVQKMNKNLHDYLKDY